MHTIPELYSILAKEFASSYTAPCGYEWLTSVCGRRLRLQIAGLGDVGRTVAAGLRVLGGEVLESVGIFDLNEAQALRLEMELNQIQAPCGNKPMPAVTVCGQEDLFDCDVFLYCATKSVPPVGGSVADVRMAQYDANRGIVGIYARQAADRHFRGLFGVVSDPVDLLCMAALRESVNGEQPLHPEQVQGFGLGVMYARAAYYAAKAAADGDLPAAWFAGEGRVFGPHGAGLVAANSIKEEHYDQNASLQLTDRTVHANQEMRALGFKPYIAPAFSSAAFSVLAAVSGKWCDSARYLNGLYFGARNRTLSSGTQWEDDILPDALWLRVEEAYRALEAFLCG